MDNWQITSSNDFQIAHPISEVLNHVRDWYSHADVQGDGAQVHEPAQAMERIGE